MSIGAELTNSQFKKFRRFNGGLKPLNLSSGYISGGEGKEEDGRKFRKRGECGEEKEIKGKWSVYLQPVHVTG